MKLGTETAGKTGDGYTYELKLRFSDDTYVTVETGTFSARAISPTLFA